MAFSFWRVGERDLFDRASFVPFRCRNGSCCRVRMKHSKDRNNIGGSLSSIKALPLVALMVCTFLFPATLFAARPLTTDDVYTVERGIFQMETGIDFIRQSNDDRELTPTLTLTYGLLERMDMAIGTSYLFIDPAGGKNENGLGDTALTIKYRLIDQSNWIPSFAVTGALTIPTASQSKGLGSGEVDLNINTIFTWKLGERWQLYANLGYTFIGEHRVRDEFNYSIAGCGDRNE
jgi:hypothetical protein